MASTEKYKTSEQYKEVWSAQGRRRRARRIQAGCCQQCQGPMPEGKERGLCSTCQEKRNLLARNYARRLKTIVYEHYGSRCSCCGETEPLFLSVDHINGHTIKRTARGGSRGYRTYKNIIDKGFPEDIRILCHNCNLGRAINGGICPHQQRPGVASLKSLGTCGP